MKRTYGFLSKAILTSTMAGTLLLSTACEGPGPESTDVVPHGQKLITGSLSTARSGHTSTLLGDGRVLAAGGGTAAAEVYSSVKGTWSSAPFMTTSRVNHTAILLSSGKVFVAGGSFGSNSLASTELFDPMATSTPAQDGGTTVADGGAADAGAASPTGAWMAGPSMTDARSMHTATLLKNGKILLVGGLQGFSTYLSSCEIYDPLTNQFSKAGSLTTSRGGHTAVLLQTGKVLVCGGVGSAGTLSSCEVFDPSSGIQTS